jgi:hypothetical protein
MLILKDEKRMKIYHDSLPTRAFVIVKNNNINKERRCAN